MKLSCTIDSSKWNQQVAAQQKAIGQDAQTVVKDEARLLLKQAMRFTPPKTLAQGRKAVKRDITRAATPLDPKSFDKQGFRKRLEGLIKAGDFAALNAIVGKFKTGGWRVEQFSPSLHTSARGSRGRVTREQKVFVTALALWRKYVAEIQSKIGRMKSGWLPAYRAAGGDDAPSWVTRHSDNPGFVIDNLADPNFPSITVTNRARGIGQLQHHFRNALNTRSKAMGKRIKLILSGYSKDVARGIRVSRKARETSAGGSME